MRLSLKLGDPLGLPAAPQPAVAAPASVSASAPAAKLVLQLRPAPELALLLATLHGLAIFCAWVSLEGIPLALVSVATVASGACTAADAWLALPGSVLRLELDQDGRVHWDARSGAQGSGWLGQQAVVWPWLVVLRIMGKPRSRWLVLGQRSADPQALRALRVRLRWGGRPGNVRKEEKASAAR